MRCKARSAPCGEPHKRFATPQRAQGQRVECSSYSGTSPKISKHPANRAAAYLPVMGTGNRPTRDDLLVGLLAPNRPVTVEHHAPPCPAAALRVPFAEAQRLGQVPRTRARVDMHHKEVYRFMQEGQRAAWRYPPGSRPNADWPSTDNSTCPHSVRRERWQATAVHARRGSVSAGAGARCGRRRRRRCGR